MSLTIKSASQSIIPPAADHSSTGRSAQPSRTSRLRRWSVAKLIADGRPRPVVARILPQA